MRINLEKVVFMLILISVFIISNADETDKLNELNYTVFGRITEKETGETLEGINIEIIDLGIGVVSNDYGYYSITIPSGKYTVKFSRIGLQTITENISLQDQSITKNVELSIQPIVLDGFQVSDMKNIESENIKLPEMGTIKMAPAELQSTPILFGEQDVIKSYQLMPGVKPAGEGNSGFHVRGGDTDQNLIILDEAPIYNASHLAGFFSVFNSDAIKDVKLYKGSAPAEYGGRLSSMMDIKMKEGNTKKYSVSGGIGLIASRLTLEGPIGSEKGSFLISGRRTYADLLLQLSSDETLQDIQLYFYDLNGKANYQFDDNNRLFISGYFGKDVLGFGGERGLDWGNSTLTLRWNHLFNNKLFSNTSLIYSNYGYDIAMDNSTSSTSVASSITDYNFKEDFNYFLRPDFTMKFGFNSIYHQFDPGIVEVEDESSTHVTDIDDSYALENAVYISNEWAVSDFLQLNFGARLSQFATFGPAEIHSYNDEGDIIETEIFEKGEVVSDFYNIEPRFTLNYLYDERSSYKFSYTRNAQYLHKISTSSAGFPTDVWVPCSKNIEPGIADQVSLGYFRNFADNNYEFSIETYYKDMQNQMDYKDNADVLMNEDLEAELLFGDAWAYGLELFLRKRFGRFTGWVGYTIATSERKFDEINDGDVFPAKQDRTHDVNITANYELNPKWTFSSSWTYYTGDAASFPIGKYEVEGQTVNLYGDRNADRMPDYHRLDLGATYHFSERSSLNFSVYNAYNNMNTYTITFAENEDDPTQTEAIKTTLFPIIPAITYNFKF